jgi:hypothetical protein
VVYLAYLKLERRTQKLMKQRAGDKGLRGILAGAGGGKGIGS